ncbi:MAG: uroporphyrinogen decarboxylase family protein [Kosmotogaceae bacterium]
MKNRLEGKKVDKPPNLNIIMAFAAKYIGINYKKYVTDYRYLVEGNIRCCEAFGIDMVSAISDPVRETYDLGANVTFPENDVPYCSDPLLKNYSELEKLELIKPENGKRMNDRLKAIRLYREKVVDYYPILGWIEGPMALASNLRGVIKAMEDFYESPDFLKNLLEFCYEQQVLFARAQVNAGADFIGIGDAVCSLIGPRRYKEYALPLERKIVDEVHKLGAKVKLHICGDVTPLLELMPETGADIIDVDWMVDFKKAAEIFRNKCSLCGNFDPVRVLMKGTPEQIKEATKKCVELGDSTTFIAAGCEVPPDTPEENFLAVKEALEEV